MTGYARASEVTRAELAMGNQERQRQALDIRAKLGTGLRGARASVRETVQRHLKRGNLQVTLACDRGSQRQHLIVNEEALEEAVALAEKLWQRLGGDRPRAESISGFAASLMSPGPKRGEETAALRDTAMLRGLDDALSALVAARRAEGKRIAAVLAAQIARIEALTIAARDSPARSVEAIRARLAEQVARLLQASASFDKDRLHQEAVLIATRADIQEEIDRLLAHVEAARKLLDSAEPVGRQFDFLAQEFNREANTLCSKAADRSLTTLGLELKPSSTSSASRSRTLNKQLSRVSIARRGLLLVMSSPSGAGKTTLSRALLRSDPNVSMSVSVTTRPPREGEVEGRDYFFISKERFAAMRDGDELLEWAQVFGNFYGTPRRPVEMALARGRDMLFDIDWQGTQQLAQLMKDDLVSIFILPPSAEELRDRLVRRAQDSAAIVAKRMAEAAQEISHWPEYDYVIVNETVADASAKIASILAAERLRRQRRIGLTEFVRKLMKEL